MAALPIVFLASLLSHQSPFRSFWLSLWTWKDMDVAMACEGGSILGTPSSICATSTERSPWSNKARRASCWVKAWGLPWPTRRIRCKGEGSGTGSSSSLPPWPSPPACVRRPGCSGEGLGKKKGQEHRGGGGASRCLTSPSFLPSLFPSLPPFLFPGFSVGSNLVWATSP